jgi:hypothetical protein
MDSVCPKISIGSASFRAEAVTSKVGFHGPARSSWIFALSRFIEYAVLVAPGNDSVANAAKWSITSSATEEHVATWVLFVNSLRRADFQTSSFSNSYAFRVNADSGSR